MWQSFIDVTMLLSAPLSEYAPGQRGNRSYTPEKDIIYKLQIGQPQGERLKERIKEEKNPSWGGES